MDKTITLTITECCTLLCTYCYEHNRHGKVMEFDTAKDILDREISDLTMEDHVFIDFFGGEPFLAFELIKRIVDYVKKQKADGKYKPGITFFATTNGTLIHGEIKEWLCNHPDFVLGLSLDGTKDAHDHNRSNSFDAIDLDFFVTQYPEQPVKMTISEYSLFMLADCVKFAHEKGFLVNCNLAYGIDWNKNIYREALLKQLGILSEYYIEYPELEPCSILSRSLEYFAAEKPKPEHVSKYCGSGTDMYSYFVDGKKYPCQFFMPISSDEEAAKHAWEHPFMKEIPVSMLNAECSDCFLLGGCPTCYGSNFISTGNIYHKDLCQCELEKIILYANAVFAIKKWNAGRFESLPDEEKLPSLFGAKRIVEHLNYDNILH